LRRLIADEVEDHLATGLLNEEYEKGDIVSVGVKGGELAYTTVKE
jgi:ATP-dependent Clp protease ATP-binding subunit ClpA